jgi:hypothetical protein
MPTLPGEDKDAQRRPCPASSSGLGRDVREPSPERFAVLARWKSQFVNLDTRLTVPSTNVILQNLTPRARRWPESFVWFWLSAVLPTLTDPWVAPPAVVRPFVGSDTAGLAAAGAAALLYHVVLVAWRHRIDLLGVLAAIGYAMGCILSALAGGSSRPLKLHDPALTFVTGLVQLVAVALRRPLPLARLLRVPATSALDQRLSVMVGTFLVCMPFCTLPWL